MTVARRSAVRVAAGFLIGSLLLCPAVVLAERQDFLVDILTAPNNYWNRPVALKGVVTRVIAEPPGTNRGRFTLRDSSDHEIEVWTTTLPIEGQSLLVRGVVEQRQLGDRIPRIRESSHGYPSVSSKPKILTPSPAPEPDQSAVSNAAEAAEDAAATEPVVAPARAQEAIAPPQAQPAMTAPALQTQAGAPETYEASSAPQAVLLFVSENWTVLLIGVGAIALGAFVLLSVSKTKPARPRMSMREMEKRRYEKVGDDVVDVHDHGRVAPSVAANKSAGVDPGSATMLFDPGLALFETDAASRNGRPMATLAVTAGPDRGRSFHVDRDSMTFGRPGRRRNDIELNDTTISREQARFVRESETSTFRVINESSTNPTKVNGQPVDNALLKDGDTIQCGETVVKLSLPATA